MIRSLMLGGAAAIGALVLASPAAAQRRQVAVTPYIELGQVLDADLNSGDVLTYSTVAVGVDVSAATPRTEAQLSYRYERRIAWDDSIGDDDVHTGLAQVAFKAAPGLTLEAGAIATRARSDIRGAAPGVLVGNVDNISQVYSVYAGPSYSGHSGPVAITAAYQVGATKVESPSGDRFVATGQPARDVYDKAVNQVAAVSVGVSPGSVMPIGVTASAGYEREDGGQLDARFEGYHARGDVLAPISPYVALTAGVGYERIETSQRDAIYTSPGAPAVDRDGRFITDPNSPRRIAYRTDGVYYDAGVVWRPNRRTVAEAHVGKRYGSVSYTGTLSYQASQDVGFQLGVYDQVTTFGQQLRQGLHNLPTSFIAARDSFTQEYNGCVFGTSGKTPGGCLNDVFQSISTASYRARGVDAVLTAQRGRSTFGAGAGYANRRLYSPSTPGVTLYAVEDQSYYGQLFYNRTLTPTSTIDANLFVNYYDPGVINALGVWSYGGTTSYGRSFGRLTTSASAGIYAFDTGDVDTQWSAQALLAARYSF